MKKTIVSLSLIAVLTCMYLQQAVAFPPIVISVAKLKPQEKEVKNFNAIAIAGPIDVIVTLGNSESLRLEGDEDDIASIVTEVKGNVLIVRPKTSWKSWSSIYRNKKITAYITAKQIRSLTMSGSGTIKVNGTLKNQSLTTTLSGSGNINAKIETADFTGIISGSGNLNISGSAEEADVNISGSGSFGKKDFTTQKLTAKISGSGGVYATVQNNIDAVISGSGSVNYHGNPIVQSKISGSGRVRKM